MTTKNKILSGLVLSTVLATGLFAGYSDKKDDMRNDRNQSHCMMKKDFVQDGKHHGNMSPINMFRQLSLTSEQETQIEKIMLESRKNMQTFDEAFTKESFDKDKYMKIMSEKRDNMLKSNTEVLEKSYALLTPKQKEQLKVLMDLRKDKMEQRIENKIKG
jgi:Spy/CpxP family protein refolding chaperone